MKFLYWILFTLFYSKYKPFGHKWQLVSFTEQFKQGL
jgi:hypothetical protein